MITLFLAWKCVIQKSKTIEQQSGYTFDNKGLISAFNFAGNTPGGN